MLGGVDAAVCGYSTCLWLESLLWLEVCAPELGNPMNSVHHAVDPAVEAVVDTMVGLVSTIDVDTHALPSVISRGVPLVAASTMLATARWPNVLRLRGGGRARRQPAAEPPASAAKRPASASGSSSSAPPPKRRSRRGAAGDSAESTDVDDLGFPVQPTPVNIFTAQVGDKVHFPRIQTHKFDGDAPAEVIEVYAPRTQWTPPHIVVKSSSYRGNIRLVEHPTLPVSDQDRRSAERAAERAAAAAAERAPAQPSPDPSPKRQQSEEAAAEPAPATAAKRRKPAPKEPPSEYTFAIPFGENVWRVRVTAGENARDGDMQKRSAEMLKAILVPLHERLKPVLSMRLHADTNAVRWVSLSWFWKKSKAADSPGFEAVMKRLRNKVGRGKLRDKQSVMTASLGRKDFTEAAYRDWQKVVTDAEKELADLAGRFHVEIDDISAERLQQQRKRKSEKVDATRKKHKRATAKDVKQNQADAHLWCFVYGLGELTSFAGYDRLRKVGFFVKSTVEGAKRKVRRSEKEGHTAVPLPTEAKVRAKQKEIMKEVGVPEGSDRVIVLQNAASESSERHNIRVVAGSAPTPDDHSQIGVVHNCAAWLALVIRVMVKAGECGLNLHDTSNGGHLGDFDGTRICMWGDGTPIASRPASCMGWTVLDPSCKLFSRGRSRPITYALWRGGEELMIRLLEQLRGELDSDGYVKVEFPEFGTYLRVKLPLRLLSADHKAWCELRGTVGSGGDRRLHWLHPSTPIHLADDVCTYRFCTNLEKMEWWMRQLHFTTKELVSKMGDANRMKVGELQAWLKTHKIDFGAKDLKPALVQQVEASPQWKGGVEPPHQTLPPAGRADRRAARDAVLREDHQQRRRRQPAEGVRQRSLRNRGATRGSVWHSDAV